MDQTYGHVHTLERGTLTPLPDDCWQNAYSAWKALGSFGYSHIQS